MVPNNTYYPIKPNSSNTSLIRFYLNFNSDLTFIAVLFLFYFEADTIPPTFSVCPSAITVNDLACTATTTTQSFPATATDNCGAVSVTYASTGTTVFASQPQSSANFNLGTSVVTATATDGFNNQNTVLCTITVTATQGL